ncbi:MAG: spore cortex-lytic enzyme [Christensenellaceae bacterium]|jgi:N-acetylmuramoyl-L-alanine amidase|nr:spore cortex-lytic enzyme [Christensenellaceae bacterium]
MSKFIQKEREITKKIIVGLLILALVILSLFLLTQLTKSQAADALVAKQGTTGNTVKSIQNKLKEAGFYNGAIDGIYGSATTSAVKKFQKSKGLKVDGIVGKNTAKLLGVVLNTTTNNAKISDGDLNLIARCIYGEARGEPYVGQVAVAAVILNRVKSPQFPNTISGVIYQPYAFTCVKDGQINLKPNANAFRAATDALNGWDPTLGCLFYYNPKTATSAWIRKKQTHITIGRHAFCL